eukprot:10881872-Ditylum_brightwellii.AAC.1
MPIHNSIFGDNEDPLHPYLVSLYLSCLLITWLYSLSRWKNLIYAVTSTKFFTDKPGSKGGKIYPGSEPHVTIQICTFNEGDVIEKTIDSACSVDWPGDKLTVQVLDDSTDEVSKSAIASRIDFWCSKGINALHMTRSNRIGYKAGCLHHHFNSVTGKEIENIGLVQAPWGYYNIHQNLLTEVDSLVLDIQHVIEQTGRAAAYNTFSFNGTGGIWRKSAVTAGGGWSW